MKKVLDRALEGNKEAEEEIFNYLVVRFNVFATQKIGDAEAAREVAQKACLAVLEKYKTETFSIGFEEWAWGVLKNNIKDFYRQITIKRKRTTSNQSLLESQSASELEVDPHLEMRVLHCLRKISIINRRYARILNLIYHGFNTDEVCRKLGISRNYCYVMLHRGRSLLKRCLETGEAR
jgi:RNA polymerase sigma factor (sigma-70 family)